MANSAPLSNRGSRIPPLHLDPIPMPRRSLDSSTSHSSVQSSLVYTPSLCVPCTPVTSVGDPSLEEKQLRYGNSNTFLTELAAQERRVLELREELQKAEGELDNLKKHWASHEAAKKRNEVRQLEQLQPIKASLSGAALACNTALNPATRDLDRQKSMPPPIRPLQRTVFSGSRHARTLSLLSPKESVEALAFPSRGCEALRHDRDSIDESKGSATTQELGTSTDGPIDSHNYQRGPPKDIILETGKQLVGDLRQGLWTFFEDLKQVTVGDEFASASDPRYLSAGSLPKSQAKRGQGPIGKRTPAKGSKISSGNVSVKHERAKSSYNPGEPYEHPGKASAPPQCASTSVRISKSETMNSNSVESDDDDGWDNWDTTTPKRSTPRRKEASSVDDPMFSPLTEKSSPRTSTSSIDTTSCVRLAS